MELAVGVYIGVDRRMSEKWNMNHPVFKENVHVRGRATKRTRR
jgi:hypothetical protein